MYEAQAGEIRKNISVAKAEMLRLKANRKITKKGQRNREKSLKSCKIISVAELLSFMERKI